MLHGRDLYPIRVSPNLQPGGGERRQPKKKRRKEKKKEKKRRERNVPQTARRRRPSGERRSGSTYNTCARAGSGCMIASLPRGMRSGLFASTARMRGARLARSVVAPARSTVVSRSRSRSWLDCDGCDEARVMTPRVRCKRRGLITMVGSSPSMGGSCASQEDVSAETASRSSG